MKERRHGPGFHNSGLHKQNWMQNRGSNLCWLLKPWGKRLLDNNLGLLKEG